MNEQAVWSSSSRCGGAALFLVIAFVVLVTAAGEARAAITEEQAKALAMQIEASLRKGDPAVLDATIDYDAIVDKATAGIKAPAEIVNGFKRGANQGKLGVQIAGDGQRGGSYTFLRLRGDDEGDRRLLFRMLTSEGALNYHDLQLGTDAAGKIRVVDVHVALAGEPLSQTLRRLFLPLAAQANRGRVAQLVQDDEDLVKHAADIQRMQQLTQANQPKEALAVYDALPESLRKEKLYMIARLMNAMKIDQPTYMAAMAEYQAQFPDDPSGVLVSLDALFLGKQYDKLLENIDTLDKSLGGDPYLNLYRANAHSAKGDRAAAKPLLAELLKAEPKLAQVHYTVIQLALEDEDFAAVARLLTAAERQAGVKFDNLENAPVFAAFVKSPEYQQWMKSRGGTGAAPATPKAATPKKAKPKTAPRSTNPRTTPKAPTPRRAPAQPPAE